eukprot:gene480-1887_t
MERSRGRPRDDARRGPVERNRDEQPTSSIYIKGLPFDHDEADLRILLQPFPNLTNVRLGRDRASGKSKGYAFAEFASEEDASRVFDARDSLQVEGRRLVIEFSSGTPPQAGGGGSVSGSGPPLGRGNGGSEPARPIPVLNDWICPRCSAVNFARRLECFQCSSVRPANPQRISADEGPSPILKVSGLEDFVTDAWLHNVCSGFANPIDVRLVNDRFTGAPRGFAFVEFATAADAARVLHGLQHRSQLPHPVDSSLMQHQEKAAQQKALANQKAADAEKEKKRKAAIAARKAPLSGGAGKGAGKPLQRPGLGAGAGAFKPAATPKAAAIPTPAPAPAPAASVQGVVHRGKWAKK